MAMHRLEIGGGPSDLEGVIANQKQADQEDQIALESQRQAQAAYEQQQSFALKSQQASQDENYRRQALQQALGIHQDEFGLQSKQNDQAQQQQAAGNDFKNRQLEQQGQLATADQANKLQMEQERSAEKAKQAEDQTEQRRDAAQLAAQSNSERLQDKEVAAIEARRNRDLAIAANDKTMPASADELAAINAKYDAMLPSHGGKGAQQAQPVQAATVQPVTNPVSKAQSDVQSVAADAQAQKQATGQTDPNSPPQEDGTHGTSQADRLTSPDAQNYMQKRDGLIAQREAAKAKGDMVGAQAVSGQLDDLQGRWTEFQAKHPGASPDPQAALEPALTHGPNGFQTPALKAKEAMQNYAQQLQENPNSKALHDLYHDAQETYQAELSKQTPAVTDAKSAADDAHVTYTQMADGLGAKVQAGGNLTPGQAAAFQDARKDRDKSIKDLADATGKPVLTPLEAANAQLEAAKADYQNTAGGDPATSMAKRRAIAIAQKNVATQTAAQDKANAVQAKADAPLWNQETARIQKQLDDIKKNGDMASGADADEISKATDQLNSKIQTIATAKSTGVPFHQYQETADKTDDLAAGVVTKLKNTAKMNKAVDDVTMGRGGVPKGSLSTQLSKLNEYASKDGGKTPGVLPDDVIAKKAMTLPAAAYLNNTLGVPVAYDKDSGTLKPTGQPTETGFGAIKDPAVRKEQYELTDALLSGDPYKYGKSNGKINALMDQFANEHHSIVGQSSGSSTSSTTGNKVGAEFSPWKTIQDPLESINVEASQSNTNSNSQGTRKIEIGKTPEDTFRKLGDQLRKTIPNATDVQGILQKGAQEITKDQNFDAAAKARQQQMQQEAAERKAANDKTVSDLQDQYAKHKANYDSLIPDFFGTAKMLGYSDENNAESLQAMNKIKNELDSRGAPYKKPEPTALESVDQGRGKLLSEGGDGMLLNNIMGRTSGAAPDGTKVH